MTADPSDPPESLVSGPDVAEEYADLVDLEKARGGCCGMPAPVAVDLGVVLPPFAAYGETDDD